MCIYRLELLNSLVSHSLFWCSGSWNLTKRQESKLRGVQQKMLLKMVGIRPVTDETKPEYMARANRRLKHLKTFHKVAEWDKAYLKSIFSWAGHVSRIKQYDKGRITYKVLTFKSWRWIQTVAEENRGCQLHGRRLRTWRWERPMYKLFTNDRWENLAQDKQSWLSCLDEMVQRWCITRTSPQR